MFKNRHLRESVSVNPSEFAVRESVPVLCTFPPSVGASAKEKKNAILISRKLIFCLCFDREIFYRVRLDDQTMKAMKDEKNLLNWKTRNILASSSEK